MMNTNGNNSNRVSVSSVKKHNHLLINWQLVRIYNSLKWPKTLYDNLSLSLSLSHTHSLSLFLSLSLSHTHTLSLFLSHTLSLFLSLSIYIYNPLVFKRFLSEVHLRSSKNILAPFLLKLKKENISPFSLIKIISTAKCHQ